MINARLNTAFKGHASIWYTEMTDIHGGRVKSSRSTAMILGYRRRPCHLKMTNTLWTKIHMSDEESQTTNINTRIIRACLKRRCNHNCTLHEISNTLQNVRKRTNLGRYTPYKSSGFKEKQPFRVDLKDKPKERVTEIAKRKRSCHNCGSTNHYANNCPKAKKKVHALEKVPEEESPTEDSDSDCMGDSIREQSYEYQDPRKEFLVEYQEDTPLEIQDIQLEAGIPQDTANKNPCKHTQEAQTFLVTPTKGMTYIHGTATRMTVCIDNSQHPVIIDSGAHCSRVARNYLDNHFPNWETQLLPTKAKNFKSASGKMTSIGTIIEEIIIPPERVISDSIHISAQDPLEELLNEFREGNLSTTLTSKQKLILLKILKKNRPAFAIGEEPLRKIRGHDMELYLDVERPYPPMLRRPPYQASLETRKEIDKHINELLDMNVIRKI
ncbi:hypothetical protein O181_089796 [Austropuccinia psidii MF-1]|uniref:CCHC-type domain-containing protein n=1 Tax=Austropuccinia psidii MF-1 TaxID=1389203 RepID=A0A9Q3IUA9_9BASI|nr:hypothetical protein [Austropuccinia psidii MF-1]